ncbi:MAG: LapA family protein [Solirubrobacterales bacterium]
MSDELSPTPRKQRGVGFYITIAAVVLAAIFILQNSQQVKVKFFFATGHTPLIFALLLATVLGFIIGLALPRFRHRDD